MAKYNTLGCRIKELRRSLSLSQAELAQQLHCTQAALSQYESGSREPGLQELIKLASVLNTTTDYLLGNTHIKSVNVNIKMIGDYLGFTEKSIEKLRGYYWEHKKKLDKDYLRKEVKSNFGVVPGDETYEEDFNRILNCNQIDLDDYLKFINDFVCSSNFRTFLHCICDNLFLERTVYDLLRVITKNYDQIESQLFESDVPAKAYALVDDSENFLKQYTINIFEAQIAIVEFCKSFTKLEIIKELDYKESFFRKAHYCVYAITRSMFENNQFSFEKFDEALSKDDFQLTAQSLELLREYNIK